MYNNHCTCAYISLCTEIFHCKKSAEVSWFKLNRVDGRSVCRGDHMKRYFMLVAEKCLGRWKNRSLRLFTRLLGAEKLFSPRHIIFKRSEHWLTEVFQKNFLHSLLSPVRHIFQHLGLGQLAGQLVSLIPGTQCK